MLKVKNLCFRHHLRAPFFFQDLSFDLEAGKLHALHGKNGIGKTVLLNILGGRQEKGSIVKGTIEGSGIMLVNQRFDQMIADQFSFLENLRFAKMGRFPSPFNRLEEGETFAHLLEQFQIDYTLPVHRLSGGQRQILAILMALQKKAKIFLLDEPTATLDEQNAKMVFDFLSQLEDLTLLVVCHDRDLVSQYVDGRHFTLQLEPSGLRTLKTE